MKFLISALIITSCLFPLCHSEDVIDSRNRTAIEICKANCSIIDFYNLIDSLINKYKNYPEDKYRDRIILGLEKMKVTERYNKYIEIISSRYAIEFTEEELIRLREIFSDPVMIKYSLKSTDIRKSNLEEAMKWLLKEVTDEDK